MFVFLRLTLYFVIAARCVGTSLTSVVKVEPRGEKLHVLSFAVSRLCKIYSKQQL